MTKHNGGRVRRLAIGLIGLGSATTIGLAVVGGYGLGGHNHDCSQDDYYCESTTTAAPTTTTKPTTTTTMATTTTTEATTTTAPTTTTSTTSTTAPVNVLPATLERDPGPGPAGDRGRANVAFAG